MYFLFIGIEILIKEYFRFYKSFQKYQKQSYIKTVIFSDHPFVDFFLINMKTLFEYFNSQVILF